MRLPNLPYTGSCNVSFPDLARAGDPGDEVVPPYYHGCVVRSPLIVSRRRNTGDFLFSAVSVCFQTFAVNPRWSQGVVTVTFLSDIGVQLGSIPRVDTDICLGENVLRKVDTDSQARSAGLSELTDFRYRYWKKWYRYPSLVVVPPRSGRTFDGNPGVQIRSVHWQHCFASAGKDSCRRQCMH